MPEATEEEVAWGVFIICMKFWQMFAERTGYEIDSDVFEQARQMTYMHIKANYENGKFDDPDNRRKARICIKKTASLCNGYVDDRIAALPNGADDRAINTVNKITKDDYILAFQTMQGGTVAPSPLSPVAPSDDQVRSGDPVPGRFHGLLCQTP